MRAIIHYSWCGESYVVNKREDCRDIVDRSAYDEYVKSGCLITMGQVIVEPIPPANVLVNPENRNYQPVRYEHKDIPE